MSAPVADFQAVLAQLEAFKRRLYLNLLLRGLILTAALLLTFFVAFTLLEYFLYLPYGARAALLFGFVAAFLYTLARWLWQPLAGFLHLRRLLTDEQAARRVGEYYPEIQDQLLNSLQLYQSSNHNELAMAALNQRAIQFAPFRLPERVRLAENRPLLKYLVPPLAIVLLVLVAYPAIFVEGSERIIHYRRHYTPKAPFDFEIQNTRLATFQGEDFDLRVAVRGRQVPEQLTIHYLEVAQPLARKGGGGLFSFTFRGVQQSIRFRLEGAGFQSAEYELRVMSRPDLRDFSVHATYPVYLRKPEEVIKNTGNLTVPEGTELEWKFATTATDALRLVFHDSTRTTLVATRPSLTGPFMVRRQFLTSQEYDVQLQNAHSANKETIRYLISTVPDRVPDISLEHFADTVAFRYLVLGGNISDDYGLSALTLQYRVVAAGTSAAVGRYNTRALAFDRRQTSTTYNFEWDLATLNLRPGDRLEYFTQVADNDGLHGPKTARSRTAELRVPDVRDLQQDLNASSQSVESALSKSLQEASKVQKELNKSDDKLKTKRDLSFQDKKGLENLVEKRQNLDQQVNDLKKKFDELSRKQDRFDPKSAELAEKSEALRKLMDDLLDPETKKLYQELEKLLQQQRENAPELQNLLAKIENKEKNLERELERALELFKQLQFDQKLEQTTQKLDDLAKKEDKLADKTTQQDENKANSPDQQELQKEQQQVKESFEDAKKELADLKALDKDLDNQNGLNEQQEEQKQSEEQTDQNLDDAAKSLSKAQNGKAGKSQKSAASKMQKMADQLAQMQQDNESQTQEENLDALRDILENLLKLSFDEESMMKSFRVVNQADPRFIQLGEQQLKLRDDARMIEDSLFALANRVFEIKSFVTREVGELNQHLTDATDRIRQRDLGRATGSQQFAMTSMNNLALMLNDVLKQMQEQMQQQMQQQAGASGKPKKGKGKKPGSSPGQQAGNKPGDKPGSKPGGKPGAGNMGQLQKALNDHIQQLKQGGKGGRGMSEELAQLAAQQEALREALQELEKMQKGKPGPDGKPGGSPLGGGQAAELKKLMEQTEADLVNKRLTEQTLLRQQDILSRLLEVDKAVKERDWDTKRESKTGAEQLAQTMPPNFQQFLRRRRAQTQLLRSVSPALSPYFQDRINQYFNRLNR